MPRKFPHGLTLKLVEAWLYRVVAPLVQGFKREVVFLVEQRDPTWRFFARKCEFVRQSSEYVDFSQAPTLEQLERFFKWFKAALSAHDDSLASFETAAGSFQDAVGSNAAARALVAQWNESFPEWTGAVPQDRANALLAEILINMSPGRSVSNHITWHRAWELQGGQALALLQDPVLSRRNAPLRESQDKLSDETRGTLTRLEQVRDDLADQFKIPPVPATPVDYLYQA